MTVCCKQCFRPVRSCQCLLTGDIVSCAPCFLLEAQGVLFEWGQIRWGKRSNLLLSVCLFVLQSWGRTQCLTQHEQTLCLWVSFTRVSFCCSWYSTPVVPAPEKLRQKDHHQLKASRCLVHRMRPCSKSTEHFPYYRTDLTSTYAVSVLQCVVEKYSVKDPGAAGDPVQKGDTCYVGRAPTGKSFRKSPVIYCIVVLLQGVAIDPSATLWFTVNSISWAWWPTAVFLVLGRQTQEVQD